MTVTATKSKPNSIVEVRAKHMRGETTIMRVDVYSLVSMYLFAGSDRFFVDLDKIEVFCDGVPQLPPPVDQE